MGERSSRLYTITQWTMLVLGAGYLFLSLYLGLSRKIIPATIMCIFSCLYLAVFSAAYTKSKKIKYLLYLIYTIIALTFLVLLGFLSYALISIFSEPGNFGGLILIGMISGLIGMTVMTLLALCITLGPLIAGTCIISSHYNKNPRS